MLLYIYKEIKYNVIGENMNNNNINSVIANNIRKYRKIQSISIEQLSELTKIPLTVLNDIESNTINREITIDEIYKISIILKTPVNKLLENNDQ